MPHRAMSKICLCSSVMDSCGCTWPSCPSCELHHESTWRNQTCVFRWRPLVLSSVEKTQIHGVTVGQLNHKAFNGGIHRYHPWLVKHGGLLMTNGPLFSPSPPIHLFGRTESSQTRMHPFSIQPTSEQQKAFTILDLTKMWTWNLKRPALTIVAGKIEN